MRPDDLVTPERRAADYFIVAAWFVICIVAALVFGNRNDHPSTGVWVPQTVAPAVETEVEQ